MDDSVETPRAGVTLSAASARWIARPKVLTAGLVGFVLVLAVIRIWLARKIATPWIMSDEFLYGELARSFADDHQPLVRGEFYPLYSVGYPLLVSPAWLAESITTTYTLAKVINVALMTSALIPVYLWSRRLVQPVYAAVATALVALLPAFVYTATIMTENASLPATMLAFFVIALMLERPTLWHQLLALGVIGLAFFIRAQALVLAVVLPLAIVVKLALDARAADDSRRWRTFARGWRDYLPLIAIYLVGAVGYVLLQAARGGSFSGGLGEYAGLTTAEYSYGNVARWTVEHMAELGFAVAIFPLSALIVLTLVAVRRGTADEAERAFLAVATSAVALVVIQVAAFASTFSLRIEERYVFYVVPLLFVALAVWLDRGLPRPLVATAVATVAPVLLLLSLPLDKRLNISILSDTLGFIPLLRLSQHEAMSTVRLLMLAGAAAAAASFALLPRRFARVVLPSALALYLVLASVQAFRTIRDFAFTTRAGLVQGSLTWIDRSLPDDASTGAILGTTVDPLQGAQALWQAEFWNRDVKGVYDLASEPSSFPKTPIAIDRLSGRLVTQNGKPYPYRYVLATEGMALAGRVIDENQRWTLYEVRNPLQLERFADGIYPDKWMGSSGALTQYTGSAGRLPISLSRAGWTGPNPPARVTVTVGKPVLGPDGQPTLRRRTARKTFVVRNRHALTVTVPVPKPPFRVELETNEVFSPATFGLDDIRALGVQVAFGTVRGGG